MFDQSTVSKAAVNSAISTVGLGRLNHVAIAVPDMQQASSLYRDVLGAEVSEPMVSISNNFLCSDFLQPQKDHGVTTVFVNLNNTKIELLHPLGEKSPIQNFLNKNPAGGVHHICIEVCERGSARV